MRYATSSWLNVQIFKLINLFLLITTCWGRNSSSEKRIWDMDPQRWFPLFAVDTPTHIIKLRSSGIRSLAYWGQVSMSVMSASLCLTASSCQGRLTMLLAQPGTHILFYLALEKPECFTSSAWDDHNEKFNQSVKTDPPWHRFYDVTNKTVTLLHWLFDLLNSRLGLHIFVGLLQMHLFLSNILCPQFCNKAAYTIISKLNQDQSVVIC